MPDFSGEQVKMSALHTITLANLTNESPLNHCLGNQKVIDSISRGIPMMCQKLDTFVEQLGDDYAAHSGCCLAEPSRLDQIDQIPNRPGNHRKS